MATTGGDTGGISNTSGTASSVCAISPSDTVGVLNNFLSRIEKIEEILMQIASANVLAGQLSELSQQVGWLYGVEYMGIPGWTQTEYGTLIPPAGFSLLGSGITLSDGSTYQAVVMDENGVLQYGFGQTASDGTFTPVTGAMASSSNLAILSTNDPIQATTTTNASSFTTLITADYDPTSLVDITSASQFTFRETGIYLLTATCTINAYTAIGGVGRFNWAIASQPTDYGIHRGNGPQVYNQSNATASNPATLSASRIMKVSSGAVHQLSGIALAGTGPATIQVGAATLGIQLLRGL
jgi:hypothetical protein